MNSKPVYVSPCFFFLSEIPHLQCGKQQQTRTLSHYSLNKFCELTFDNIFCVHFFSCRFKKKKSGRIKNSGNVEPANPFCLQKLVGIEDFAFPAHLTLHDFLFLGRKGVLWFGLQMAKWMIVPLGFINQAFGLVGNTFWEDWCQCFFLNSTVHFALLIYLWNKSCASCLRKEICW